MNEFNKIEKKWQNLWEEKKTFKTRSSKKKKFYNLEMFPYPSGLGLHMGHARTYCIGDCYARFKRLQGFNVLYPMGYDAFGLPAENAAIKEKTHPKIYTENAIKNFRKQLTELGLSYDWDKSLATCYPDYYKWNQWFFLKFYEKGLAYRKKAPINWCPKDQTVLANEQVIDGKCWRCETKVEVKQLEQWFFKITDYAEELLKDIKKLDWPEKIKLMQENWIGKSEGTLAKFKLKDSNEYLEIFTTRIDTLFSVTFLVMAPEHPKVLELVKGTSYESKAKEFINKIVLTEKFTRTAEDKEKEGFFTGRYAINPATNKEIPIYLANFVVMDYGTGVVMANAHDERDVEFSKKYNIPLIQVLKHKDNSDLDKDEVYTDYGILKNSDQFNNLKSEEAIPKIQSWLQSKNLGKKTIQYKIRDWLISRQRYWGTPIPIVYCDKCGIVTVSEKQLPVLLPENVKFTGEGNPLLNSDKFVNVRCPKCKSKARRETDTMDTFVDSSWYFLRYTSNKEKKAPFKKEAVKHWLPVDTYIGGAEHAVLHLLYARFFTKVLRDMKLLSFDEPFLRLFSQGTVTKNNVRMSKSHGNVVSQDEIVNKYGIDTARLYLLFVSSPDKDLEWNDEGAEGAFRFINKFYSLYNEKHSPISNLKDKFVLNKLNKTIKEVSLDIEEFKLNLALIKIMELVNYIIKNKEYISQKVYKDSLTQIAILVNPFIPHISEECWHLLNKKGFSSLQKWPKYNKSKTNEELEAIEYLIESTKEDIRKIKELVKIEPKEITLFVSEKWKYDFYHNLKKELEKTRDIKTLINKSMIKEHGQEISKIIPSVINNPQKLPLFILNQKTEFDYLVKEKSFLEKEFNVKINIILSDNNQEQKAKQSIPGKPAIILK